MPNWITNKVKAPSHVIASMINEKGIVDFNRIIAFEGDFPWNSVSMDAEQLAEVVIGKPLDAHPLIASLEAENRRRTTVKGLSDEFFEQFVQMLRNYRKCDVLHDMDFARKHWGTKWNACEPEANVEAGTAQFDTAWSCPSPVFEALSKKFPDDLIEVTYADEDIGSNCGTFTLKSGEEVSSEIAPSWGQQSDAEKAKWRAFAYDVKGRTPDEEDED